MRIKKIIFLLVFLYLISVSLELDKETCFITSETEEECGTVFYPIVKPLLRYFEICRGKDLKYSEVLDKYLNLTKKHSEVQEKYSKLQEKHSELQDNNWEYQKKYFDLMEKYLKLKETISGNYSKNSHIHSELLEKYSMLQDNSLKVIGNYSENQHKYSELLEKYSQIPKNYTEVLESYLENQQKYSGLLEKYSKFSETTSEVLENLNKNSELLEKYATLQEKSLKVIGNYSKNQHKYSELLEKYSQIPENYTEVLQSYLENQQKYTELMEKYSKLPETTSGNQIENKTSIATTFSDPCLEAKTNTVHEIELPVLLSFKVVCHSEKEEGSGWMKVVHKLANSKKFNRTYEEFRSGFGDLRGEFFIGLERLYLMTNQVPHESHVSIECEGEDEDLYLIKCNHFVLGNEKEDYKLTKIENCSGETSNWLQDTTFSTYDRYDQNLDDNIARDSGFGWWHGSGEDNDFRDCLIKMMIRRK